MGTSTASVQSRLQRLIEDDLSDRAAARRLLISAATGVRLASKVRCGESLVRRTCGRPPGRGKLGPHRDFLRELVEQDPDVTLFESRDALADAEDVHVHRSAIAKALRRLGFGYKSRWWPPSGAVFATCVEAQLAPALQPGTAVIPDNPSTHKSARAAAAFGHACCLATPDECWNFFRHAGYAST